MHTASDALALDSEPPESAQPSNSKRERFTGTCRRCQAPYACHAIRVGPDIWPFTFFCDACFDIERAAHDAARVAEMRAKRADAWSSDVGREAFADTIVAQLDPVRLAAVVGWVYGPRGLVLHGPSGKTKSRMMWILARRLYVDDGVQTVVARATRLARTLSDLATPAGAIEAQIRALINAPVLILDDLGKEAQSERWESALVEIIDARTAAGRPLIITTNYVGSKLVERYRDRSNGEAVVRRLRDFCTAISFTHAHAKPL